MTIDAPSSSRTVLTGIWLATPPSTSSFLLIFVGGKMTGRLQLACTAFATEPDVMLTFSPVLRSVATAAKGILSAENFFDGRMSSMNAAMPSLDMRPIVGTVNLKIFFHLVFRAMYLISDRGMPAA